MPFRTIAVDAPLDLRASIATLGRRYPGQPKAGADEAWWIGSTPEGLATVHLRHHGGEIAAEAWGAGADWALDRLPRLVGLDDGAEDFDPPRGLVRELNRRARGLRLGSTGRVVDVLIPVILGQRVTIQAANESYRRMVWKWGRPAPGPIEAMTPPDPAALAALHYHELHPLGVERQRAVVVIEAARRASRLEEVVGMEKDAAYRRLQAVRGIGIWTAAQAMGVAWGDPDAVPVGDFHIPHMVSWALAGEPRGDDARMLELLAPYAGHRRRVLVLLKSAGVTAPRYGPKTAVRSFESQ
jgi:3-methyladenine DNA glycosylase/8-oxoguanine DNA glycosylase